MTTRLTIYHNPRCSKSRQTLELLHDHGYEPEVIEYLKSPPGQEELETILTELGMAPRDLMRKNEEPYKQLNLDRPELSRSELIDAMVRHPILIERPIVRTGSRAALGRPPEKVLELLSEKGRSR